MANSINIYTVDGTTAVTKQFAVNFTLDYLSKDHVVVFVDGELDGGGDQIFRAFTFVNDFLIEVTDPITEGDVLNVRRDTPADALQHNFAAGAVMTELNLDQSHLQTIMLVHEVFDGRGISNFTEDLNMNLHDILNAGTVEMQTLLLNGQVIQTVADLTNAQAAPYITTAALVLASLTVGQTVSTQGHTTSGDGFGAVYIIRSAAQFGRTPDEHKDFTLINGNIAVFQHLVAQPTQVAHKKDFHTGNFNSDAWAILQSEGGDYHAFPTITQAPNGRILATWMHQTQHSGGVPADVVSAYSDDGGDTFSSLNIIYGNRNGPDSVLPYFQGSGVDRWGRFVSIFGITGGSTNRPSIKRSWDGVNWSAAVELTFSGDTVNLSNTIVSFNEIKLLPDGNLAMAVYQEATTESSHVAIIDDLVDSFNMELRAIVEAPGGVDYSEFAFVALTGSNWFAFMRQDGATNSIPYFSSNDAGATWVDEGTMGDNGGVAVGGGWVVQSAERVTINETPHILVSVGARPSVSAPITEAPAVVWFAAPAEGLKGNTSVWRKVHEISVPDNGFDRGSYNSFIVNDTTGDLMAIADEETATDESRIITAVFNYREKYNAGVAAAAVLESIQTANINFNSVTVTYTDQVGTFERIGNQVFGRIEINYTALDTADASGISVVTSGFPFPITAIGPCSLDTENSTGVLFQTADVVYAHFSAANGIVQVDNARGTAYGYNGGDILAAGKLILYVQYTTT